MVAGTVTFILPDSGVPMGQGPANCLVRIHLDGDEPGRGEFCGRVKLGMAGQADIVMGQERLLALLVRMIRQRIVCAVPADGSADGRSHVVIEIAVLPVFDIGQDLSPGRPIAFQLVRDDYARHLGQPVQ